MQLDFSEWKKFARLRQSVKEKLGSMEMFHSQTGASLFQVCFPLLQVVSIRRVADENEDQWWQVVMSGGDDPAFCHVLEQELKEGWGRVEVILSW